ncbi:MAG: hypothetical protein ACE5G8_09615 [Anaerolineae bacterium]
MSDETLSPPNTAARRADFWLLLALFVSFRLLTLFLLRPGGFIRDWSDFDTYLGIAALSDYGLYPFRHFWLEWPPAIPWLMVGAYKLSLLLPAWEDPRFWFVSVLGTALVAFEAGNFALVYRLARRLYADPARVTRVLWLYAGLFPPVYAMLGFFDGAALFFILLSLELILAKRYNTAAVVTAAGFVVKLTPVLTAAVAARVLLPSGSLRSGLREWGWKVLRYGLLFFAAAALLLAPFWLAEPQWLATSFRATMGRASWETVWAALEGYYGFGVVLGNRLNPAETAFAVHAATLPWGLISLAFAALYAVAFFRPADYSRPRPVIAFTGLTVTLFLLYSKGYSPQFLVYVLPFIILLLPNIAGAGYALALTALNVLEQPIYFVMLPGEHWLLIAIVAARFVLFAALGVEFGVQSSKFKVQGSETLNVKLSRMRLALAAMMLLGLLLFVPKGLSAYRRVQLERSPQRDLIGFLQTQAAGSPAPLLLADQTLYRQLYPYLRRDYRLKLAGGDALYPAAPVPADLLAGESQAWLLAAGPQGEAVSKAMARLGSARAVYQFEAVGSLTLYDLAGNGAAPLPLAHSENGAELVSFQLEQTSAALNLTLYWQTTQPLPADYTVFTQLLAPDGRFVAGHDGLPAGGSRPTSGWPAATVIADAHAIPLPDNLPPGEYRLVAGLYNSAGTRLPLASPAGLAVANDALTLAPVTLP